MRRNVSVWGTAQYHLFKPHEMRSEQPEMQDNKN